MFISFNRYLEGREDQKGGDLFCLLVVIWCKWAEVGFRHIPRPKLHFWSILLFLSYTSSKLCDKYLKKGHIREDIFAFKTCVMLPSLIWLGWLFAFICFLIQSLHEAKRASQWPSVSYTMPTEALWNLTIRDNNDIPYWNTRLNHLHASLDYVWLWKI